MKISGTAVNQLFDFGGTTVNSLTINTVTANAGDAGITINAGGGGAATSASMKAITSNGFNGEVQFGIATNSPRGWEFYNNNSSTLIASISGTAPASSLVVSAAGNIQTAGGFCFTSGQCITAGAGAPAGGACGSSNTGSMYLNNTAVDASHVLYVCQGSSWTAVTVP